MLRTGNWVLCESVLPPKAGWVVIVYQDWRVLHVSQFLCFEKKSDHSTDIRNRGHREVGPQRQASLSLATRGER